MNLIFEILVMPDKTVDVTAVVVKEFFEFHIPVEISVFNGSDKVKKKGEISLVSVQSVGSEVALDTGEEGRVIDVDIRIFVHFSQFGTVGDALYREHDKKLCLSVGVILLDIPDVAVKRIVNACSNLVLYGNNQ